MKTTRRTNILSIRTYAPGRCKRVRGGSSEDVRTNDPFLSRPRHPKQHGGFRGAVRRPDDEQDITGPVGGELEVRGLTRQQIGNTRLYRRLGWRKREPIL